MKGNTMLNTTKNVALFVLDVTEVLGPLMLFCVIFMLIGLASY